MCSHLELNLLTHFQVEESKIPGIHTMQEICPCELPNEKNRSSDNSSACGPMSKGQREIEIMREKIKTKSRRKSLRPELYLLGPHFSIPSSGRNE